MPSTIPPCCKSVNVPYQHHSKCQVDDENQVDSLGSCGRSGTQIQHHLWVEYTITT